MHGVSLSSNLSFNWNPPTQVTLFVKQVELTPSWRMLRPISEESENLGGQLRSHTTGLGDLAVPGLGFRRFAQRL